MPASYSDLASDSKDQMQIRLVVSPNNRNVIHGSGPRAVPVEE
jgi:hypothetical protein